MDALPLFLVTIGAVVVLFLLIMGLKLHSFVALLGVSIIAALLYGIPPQDIADTVEEGMGGTLGFVAIVVGLGAMFGQVLRVSGGARRIATTLVDAFGEKRVPWSLGVAGFIVAIPVFFDVALVLLIPLVYTLTRKLGASLVTIALPMLAGISAAHSLVPPTPGPVAAAGALGADLGWVILFGIVAGLPAVVVAGILYGRLVGKRIEVGIPSGMDDDSDDDEDDSNLPSFWLVLSILLVPLVLIFANTFAEASLDEEHPFAQVAAVIGDPFVALIIALLLSFYVLGMRQGLSRDDLQSVATKALEPVAMILLVTGAGGVFGAVLQESGLGDELESFFSESGMPIILLAFIAAVLFRVALGSGTVAMVTSAAIVAQVIDGDVSAPLLGAIVIAIGAGSTVLSHVNDSGFWLVNRYLGLSEKQTIVAWTGMQTILGVVSFLIVLAISFFL